MRNNESNELARLTSGAISKILPGREVYVYDPPSGSDIIYRLRFPIVALLIVAALFSATTLRSRYEDPRAHAATIQILDEKKTNVLGMIATSTSLSVGISAIPDDVGSAASAQLMEISTNLGIVLGVLYLEKYLLAILTSLSFGIIIPIALVLIAIAAFGCRMPWRGLWRLGFKILLLGVILATIIPVSTQIADIIDRTYETSQSLQQEQEEKKEQSSKDKTAEKKDDNLLDTIGNFFASLPGTIVDGAKKLGEDTLSSINDLIESLAVMVVTSCVIPILVLLFSLWVSNILLGIDVSGPRGMLIERTNKMKPRKEAASQTNSVTSDSAR